jgi:cytochrome c-type biogenesis protein CcmH/NrfF
LVTPLVLLLLLVVALALYKRRQRARDRREWERTDEAIGDNVRQVGGTPAAPWT